MKPQLPIKIMIVDDHHIFREGLTGMFKKQKNIDLVGQAENGQEFLDLARKLKPHVVLMDIMMPVMDGIEATTVIKRRQPDVKVIALSMFNDDHLVLDMIEAGADGYLLKNTHKTEILDAIYAVHNKERYYCKETSDKLFRLLASSRAEALNDANLPEFSNKETEVIRCICEGLSNKEIGDKICQSIRTVEGYRNKVYHKMKVRNTAGIVVYAIRHKIYTMPEE